MIMPDTRTAGFLLAGISAAALVAAFIAQFVFGLEPCVLCIYQRIPFAVVFMLGLFLSFAPAAYPRWVLALSGLTFLAGAAIAGFHTGVEYHWWEGTNSCGINLEGKSFEEIKEQIMNAPRARCDEVAWSLFGISMAGYNALMSFALSLFTFVYLGKKKDL